MDAAVIRFPRYIIEAHDAVLGKNFLKMYSEHGGVPLPVTPDHFCTALEIGRTLLRPGNPLDVRARQDVKIFLKNVHDAVQTNHMARVHANPGNPGLNNLAAAAQVAELSAQINDLAQSNTRLAAENQQIKTAINQITKNRIHADNHHFQEIDMLNRSTWDLWREIVSIHHHAHDRVDALEAKVDTHQAEVAQVAVLEAQLATLNAKVTALESRISRVTKLLKKHVLLKTIHNKSSKRKLHLKTLLRQRQR